MRTRRALHVVGGGGIPKALHGLARTIKQGGVPALPSNHHHYHVSVKVYLPDGRMVAITEGITNIPQPLIREEQIKQLEAMFAARFKAISPEGVGLIGAPVPTACIENLIYLDAWYAELPEGVRLPGDETTPTPGEPATNEPPELGGEA